jgi:hypothetical protein
MIYHPHATNNQKFSTWQCSALPCHVADGHDAQNDDVCQGAASEITGK